MFTIKIFTSPPVLVKRSLEQDQDIQQRTLKPEVSQAGHTSTTELIIIQNSLCSKVVYFFFSLLVSLLVGHKRFCTRALTSRPEIRHARGHPDWLHSWPSLLVWPDISSGNKLRKLSILWILSGRICIQFLDSSIQVGKFLIVYLCVDHRKNSWIVVVVAISERG